MTGRPTIAAALCWHDEQPRLLRRVVESIAPVADVLVSLDGPYADYPASGASPQEQHEALREACRVHAVPHIALGNMIGATQAAKRTYLYRTAALEADWLLIIDADEQLRVRSPRDLRRRLGGFDAAGVLVQTGAAAGVQPRLLRSMHELTCGPEYHGMLSATGDDGRRVCIRDRRQIIMGENPRPRRAREVDVSDMATIINHTDDRPDGRRDAKREYVQRRTAAGRDL